MTSQKTAQLLLSGGGSQDALKFLLCCVQDVAHAGERTTRLIKPLQKGTIIRSDIVSLRLKDALWVERAASFSAALRLVDGEPLDLESVSFLDLFRGSAGAVLFLRESSSASSAAPSAVTLLDREADFEAKMSMCWVFPQALGRKRILVVGISPQDPSGGGWTQFARNAAQSLGIDLVFLAPSGSWITRAEYSGWCESVLPISAWSSIPDEGMVDRIVAAVKSYGKTIDGIVTFLEPFHVVVSRAASQLGLAHQPPESYAIATDKHQLGIFEGRQCFHASASEEALEIVKREGLSFPLVLKPCFGINSNGVVRVDNTASIPAAVDMIHDTFCPTFTMEKYCGGPEVDVNMIMIDKEVIFCEISDDFPKGADTDEPGSSQWRTFQETNMVFPSALPPEELEILRNGVRDTILRLGFSDAMMHVEARIDNSRSEYRADGEGGIVDIHPKTAEKEKKKISASQPPPQTWIIEINPRPPGLIASPIVASVYGIDYWGVGLLLAVGDKGRARALSRPFGGRRTTTRTGAQPQPQPQPQHTGVLVLIGADYDRDACAGVFDSDDICEELFARRPALRRSVSRYGCLLKRGEAVPHLSSGRNTFVAYFDVFSPVSRRCALEIAAEIRAEVRFSFR
ncbi:hypothetical protein F4778DRAFT_771425 [Xylariomycetidae sp. FL2044]|nr:hypothetical protein F4778DRAFT_771425 [Xylariomycetidae sp. FL2044]